MLGRAGRNRVSEPPALRTAWVAGCLLALVSNASAEPIRDEATALRAGCAIINRKFNEPPGRECKDLRAVQNGSVWIVFDPVQPGAIGGGTGLTLRKSDGRLLSFQVFE